MIQVRGAIIHVLLVITSPNIWILLFVLSFNS